jgi:hypothetical protein
MKITKSQIRLLIREELSNSEDSIKHADLGLESIVSELKKLYPAFNIRTGFKEIHLSLRTPTSVYSLKLAPSSQFKVIGRYESNWYSAQKWVCQVSASHELGHGTRYGGDDPIECVEEALEGLRGFIERIKKEICPTADYLEKQLLNR